MLRLALREAAAFRSAASPPRRARADPSALLPPRPRSSWTKRLITSDDYSAVQINVGDVDPVTGKYTGTFKTFAISGYLRDKGESDMALTALVAQAK